MKNTGKGRGIPLEKIQLEAYKDPKRASYAIKLALEEFEKDNDIVFLLDTLRMVAKAQGGIASISRKAAISRKSLHEALSPDGNPRLRTFQAVLDSLGLRMSVKQVRHHALSH